MFIEIEWKGETYTITERDAFEVADAIEDVVTLGQLVQMRSDGENIRFARLAKAYSAMLNATGAQTTPDEVRNAFLAGLQDDNPLDRLKLSLEAIDNLIIMVMGDAPKVDPETADTDDTEKK